MSELRVAPYPVVSEDGLLVGLLKRVIPEFIKEPLRDIRGKLVASQLPLAQPVVREIEGVRVKFNLWTELDYNRIYKVGFEEKFRDRVFTVIKETKSCPVFWDIGAAQGVYAIPASLIRREAVVLAIDPDPESKKSFQANSTLNGLFLGSRLKFDDRAVSEISGREVVFHFTEKANCAPSLKPTNKKLDSTTCAKTVTLDALITEGNLTPTAIKIDVEGAENLVLQGGQKLFKENPPKDVFLELHHNFLKEHFNSSSWEVRTNLASWGYTEVFCLDRSATSLCHFIQRSV